MSTTIEQLKENTENFKPLQISGNIRQIGPIKNDSAGNDYQIIYIEDGTGDLKVKIKVSSLFGDEKASGKSKIIIRATKGPRNVPVGLVYLAEKEMLVVSDGAEIIEDVPPVVEEVKKEKTTRKAKAPANVSEPYPQPHAMNEGQRVQLTETHEAPQAPQDPGEYAYAIVGPSDGVIYEEFLERAHIYQLIRMYNGAHGNIFPQEHLLPMTTSILIDARRANAKILDHNKGYDNSKKKIAQETTPSEKKNEPKPEPKKEEQAPLALKTSLLIEESYRHHDQPFFKAKDFDGQSTIGAVFDDNERRPKMIKWAYSMAKKKLPEAKKTLRDNIFAMVAAFNKYERITLIQEAIMHDIADANDYVFNFDKENRFFARVDDKANEIIQSILNEEAFDAHKAALAYFTGDFDKTLPEK